jgi:hypothetical protein
MEKRDTALPADATSTSITAEPSRRSSSSCDADAMLCERCGKAEMYRMHAVWRCPECGFKTDCCGW